MAEVNLTKQLAGGEDIVIGKGVVGQTRNGTVVTISKVDLALGVTSEAALTALDVTKYHRAHLYESETRYIEYLYDETRTDGIPSSGAGTWILQEVYGTDLPLNENDSQTVTAELLSLDVEKAQVEQTNHQNLLGVITEEEPHFNYEDGCEIVKSSKLVQLGASQVISDTSIRSDSNLLLQDINSFQQILFDQQDTRGAAFVLSNNGIRIVTESDLSFLYFNLAIAVTGRRGSAPTFPATVEVELFKDGAPLSTPVVVSQTFTTDEVKVFKPANALVAADLDGMEDNAEFSLHVRFAARTNEYPDDTIVVHRASRFIIGEDSLANKAWYIPARSVGSRFIRLAANATQAVPAAGATEIGGVVEWAAAQVNANTADLSFLSSINAVLFDVQKPSVYDLILSLPLLIDSGNATAEIRITGVIESSADSTDGIDGTWTQQLALSNSAVQSAGNDGDVEIEFSRPLLLTEPGLYRLRIYFGDVGSGTAATVINQFTDAGTGFVCDTRPLLTIKEAPAV